MELLDLKGTIITADAMNTQKKIASKAIELGADYMLPIKENQASLLEEVELLFKEVQDKKFQGIDADNFETAEKGHGHVENSLHLVLDVTFREDHLRYRDRIGAQNLATIRKLTHAALTKENTLKCGKAGKRVAAATNPEYREKIIKLFL